MIKEKIYRFSGIDTAIELLRPEAKWEFSGTSFNRWDDPRPQPTLQEIQETIEKVKAFEESINTVWLPKQLAEINKYNDMIEKAMNGNS